MEKWIWFSMLTTSVLVLAYLLLKNSKYRVSLKKIVLHWIVAAVFLFILNSNELTASVAVPITPISLSAIAILGIPGLALMQGIYFIT